MHLSKGQLKMWRDFGDTQACADGIQYLRETAPTPVKGTADEIIFDAGKVAGYMKAIADFQALSERKISERPAETEGLEENPVSH